MHLFDRAYYKRAFWNTVQRDKDVRQQFSAAKCALECWTPRHVKDVIDFGPGTGPLRPIMKAHNIRYVGVEPTDWIAKARGWKHGSVVNYECHAEYDMVICYDVLMYLTDVEIPKAIETLYTHTWYALWFDALTEDDMLDETIDCGHTDNACILRPAQWYRKKLSRYFRPLGMGLWLPKDSALTPSEMMFGR